jgi:acyl dehydratase
MPSLSTLPIELWLDIVELLRSSGAPITGVNAGWTKLSNVCPVKSGDTINLEPWATANRERNWKLSSSLGNLRL